MWFPRAVGALLLGLAGCAAPAAPPRATTSPAPPPKDPWDVILGVLNARSSQFNEVLTLGELRSAASAQAALAGEPAGTFADPSCLAGKGGPAEPALTPTTRGYHTTFHPGPRSAPSGCGVSAFAYVAVPEEPGRTGVRAFCIDDRDEMRSSTTAVAPGVKDGRCSPDWPALADAPQTPLSEADQRAALQALDSDPRAAAFDAGAKESVRALLKAAGPAATPAGRAHATGVNALAFSPDGRAVVSGAFENPDIKVWSPQDARLSTTWKGACGDGVWRVVVPPGAATVVAACADASVRLLSLDTGQATGKLGEFDTSMVGLSATGDGRSLLVSAAGKSTVVALPAGAPGRVLDGGALVANVGAISRDGALAAAAGWQAPLRLWALPGGQRRGTLALPPELVMTDMTFSPDGRFLAGGFQDGSVALWRIYGRRQVWLHKEHGFAVNAIAFTADGTSLVTASSDHTVKAWAVPSGEVKATLRGHDEEVYSLAVSPDGRTAATGDRAGVVLLWDLESGSSRGLVDPAVR